MRTDEMLKVEELRAEIERLRAALVTVRNAYPYNGTSAWTIRQTAIDALGTPGAHLDPDDGLPHLNITDHTTKADNADLLAALKMARNQVDRNAYGRTATLRNIDAAIARAESRDD